MQTGKNDQLCDEIDYCEVEILEEYLLRDFLKQSLHIFLVSQAGDQAFFIG